MRGIQRTQLAEMYLSANTEEPVRIEGEDILKTDRFLIAALRPSDTRSLFGILLKNAELRAKMTWLGESSEDASQRESALLEKQCAAGAMYSWGIVELHQDSFVGAVLAGNFPDGVRFEVLCRESYADKGVADEVCEPLLEWLQENRWLPEVAVH